MTACTPTTRTPGLPLGLLSLLPHRPLRTGLRRAWALAAALGIAAGMAAPAAHADGADLTGARQAVQALGDFQRSLGDLRQAAALPLGPYPLETQCSWCSEHAWWGFGTCTETTTRTQRATVDFSWTRGQLMGLLNQAQAQTERFNAGYAPTQAWLRGMPGLTRSMQSTADLVQSVQQQIRAGQGPNDTQRQQVAQSLQALVDEFGASSRQVSGSTAVLTGFLQAQSQSRVAIQQAIAGADQSARDALARFETDTRTWQCQDGLAARFEQMRNDFAVTMQRIAQVFQQLQAHSQSAEAGLATMSGTLVSAQGDIQAILTQLRAAQADRLGSFLEQLHLDSANRQWQQLAQYAAQTM